MDSVKVEILIDIYTIMDKKTVIINCEKLLNAYKKGLLGQTVMPEDSNPGIGKMNNETRLAYFSLPMSLNYQRDSYKLWQAALKTFQDSETKDVFDIACVVKLDTGDLMKKLLKHKLALQPNKHINTWQTISNTVYKNWGSFSSLIGNAEDDFLKIRNVLISLLRIFF